MPFYELKWRLAESIAGLWKNSEITAQTIHPEFTSPPNISMGHLALPCFKLSKILGKPSQEIAKELASRISTGALSAVAAGPYANFRWNPHSLYTTTYAAIRSGGERYGSDDSGKGRRVIIEYCSPNIAKKLAFHHIRSTLIGNALANVHDFLGYQTIRINFVGDWGAQFARLLSAVEMWGDRSKLSATDITGSMAHLSDLYVRFHKDLDSHPERLEAASESLKRLEAGDRHATELWTVIRQISITGMEVTLARMGIRFNYVEGESHYVPHIERTLESVKSKADAKLSEGAWIVDVPGLATPALIQKRDGTTLYLTRDIAAALDRFARFDFHRMLYVVSEQQRLHFQLLFGVLEKMGYAWSKSCEHISFGTVLFGLEKMSSREGRVVLLDEILDEARALALLECTRKNPELADKEAVAQMVGVGAIVFGELSVHRERDMEFDWQNVLAFDGDTGPYVQYALVRCRSLLAKAREKGEAQTGETAVPAGYEFSQEEEALILSLSKFRATLKQVLADSEPYHLAHHVLDVAKSFNKFYYRFPVLQASDPTQRGIRLSLVWGTEQVLANGLRLMGIACPREM